ncbi:MAG: hypothetical protein AAF492_32620, partial [Verrucomicrobiota bacterium]
RRDAKGTAGYIVYRRWTFGLIAKLAQRLAAMPEGNGTMLDNTVIVYMSDAPDTHHSTVKEWPLVVLGNLKGKLKLGGRYLSYPGYGQAGHRTMGSFYTTLLNAAGVNDAFFGGLDAQLDPEMQTGPLPEILAV